MKLAATELGGNGRRTKPLEKKRHKMNDTERNRFEVSCNK